MEIAIIFDMDGVLIDSQPLHYEIDMRVLSMCGIKAELDMVTPFTGMSNPDRWPSYKKIYDLNEPVERLISFAEAQMREIFEAATLPASDGIPLLLQGLKASGIKTGVASSSSHELIQRVLNSTGIAEYFDVLVSGEDVKNGKPAPDIYLKAAKAVGMPPARCIAIEDAAPGVLAAKNAGLTCIAYRNTNTANQDFTHADFVADKFSECLPVIKNLQRMEIGKI